MPSLLTTTQNYMSSVFGTKVSEKTATNAGTSADAGSNISAAIPSTLPKTSEEIDQYLLSASSTISSGGTVTADAVASEFRASRDSQAANAASAGTSVSSGGGALGLGALGFSLGDVSKKVSEGYSSLAAKFSSTDISKKFDGIASSAKTFLFGDSPEAIAAKNTSDAKESFRRLEIAQQNEVSAATLKANGVDSQASKPSDTSHMVSLTDAEGFKLDFVIMPEITENRTVEYEPVAPPQFPGAFQKYKGTSSVQWTVNATFVCRTTEEATQNLEYLNRLRGWTIPYFGNKLSFDQRFKDKLGAPPPVLKFKGFRESIIGEVPVVITGLNWNWPRDVDYIPAYRLKDAGGVKAARRQDQATIPFPTIIQVSISLVESFSTDQFNNLNIAEYRLGHMGAAFEKEIVEVAQAEGTSTTAAAPEAQTSPKPSASSGSSALSKAKEKVAVKVSEAKTMIKPPKFTSGSGGDFGGGGASGGW